LHQEGVPSQYRHETEEFWRVKMIDRMKVVFGFGAARFF